MKKAKPFPVSQAQVWEAWRRVKRNQGGAGVDGMTLADFEANLEDNLYKLWNRMASGSYHPKPVRRVDIPKSDGSTRPLGIPTVTDRIAQMVAKMALEEDMEREFHEDSYGYRPGKSAHDALKKTRKRCWDRAWVLDLDIKAFFDTIDHTLLMRAVRKHTSEKWLLLYIQRWLTAPVVMPDGEEAERTIGTPQGGVISPILANLFLHYAFDKWMTIYFPTIPFERYADDIVCHCHTERQARNLWAALERRFAKCALSLHPEKTRIVYCKQSNRKGNYPDVSFTFLGFTFRPRRVKSRGGRLFTGYTPAISRKAAKAIRQDVRSWRLCRQTSSRMEDLARHYNAKIRGWLNYYGAHSKWILYYVLQSIDGHLVAWARRKYKRLRRSKRRGYRWLRSMAYRNPHLFAHWPELHGPSLFKSRRLHEKSRVR